MVDKHAKKPNFSLVHWADVTAHKVIHEKGDKESYTIAAGITPSGVVHIGNFREIITNELVKRGLESRGKKVRFIYSWDDFDVFRKVPKNMPRQDDLQHELRKPIVEVFDPHGNEESYARANQVPVEEQVKLVGIHPEFIYQNKEYRKGAYAQGIRHALQNVEKIKEILNVHRKEPLADDWLPVGVFSKKFGTDEVKNVRYDGEWTITYELEDGTTESQNFKEGGDVKLKWRVDWPMRWDFEQVDFEPGGKDHSTKGGSYDTGKEIVKQLWNREAPTYIMYDFINVKGQAGKMSSSKGDVITVIDVLKVYEPEILRYLFAGTRPNTEFSISFDVDVIKVYEDFDKCERIYFGLEKAKNDKEEAKQKRIYELSAVEQVPKAMPYQPSFRHLTMLLQMHEMDIDKTINYLEHELKNDFDKQRLRTRAICAKNWLEMYAPEDFKFTVQDVPQVTLVQEQVDILHTLAEKLLERDWTDKELHEEIYVLCTNEQFPHKDFFKTAYNVLINKDKGPKLAGFILEIGKERVAKLFKMTSTDAIASQTATDLPNTVLDDKTKDDALVVASLVLTGIENKKNRNKGLDKKIKELESQVKEDTLPEEHSVVLAAYQTLIDAGKTQGLKRHSAAELLIKMLKEKGKLPSISRVVDCMNLVSVKYGVTISAWDLSKIKGDIHYTFSKGGESYSPFMEDAVTLEANEMIATDDEKLICLVRYRDADVAPITVDTTDTVIHIQGVHGVSKEHLQAAMSELKELLHATVGGTVVKEEITN